MDLLLNNSLEEDQKQRLQLKGKNQQFSKTRSHLKRQVSSLQMSKLSRYSSSRISRSLFHLSNRKK